jgi:ABC-type lipoprotein release transport system permease subunit
MMDAAIIGVIGTVAGAFIGFWGAMKAARFQHFFSYSAELNSSAFAGIN